MSPRFRVVALTIALGVLTSGAFVAGVWYFTRESPDDGTGCVYSFVKPDTDELARRMLVRALRMRNRDSGLVLSHDEWWRRARFLPARGVAQCPGFLMTTTYAVEGTDGESIQVEGDQEAYRRWRDSLEKRKRRTDPLWVDVRRWERR